MNSDNTLSHIAVLSFDNTFFGLKYSVVLPKKTYFISQLYKDNMLLPQFYITKNRDS